MNPVNHLQRYADIKHIITQPSVAEVKFDTIYGIVGDSPLPLLALVEGTECSSFTFFYTPQKNQKVSNLERYFTSRYSGKSIEFDEIPPMNEPSEQVLAIAERVGGGDYSEHNSSAVLPWSRNERRLSASFLLARRSPASSSISSQW